MILLYGNRYCFANPNHIVVAFRLNGRGGSSAVAIIFLVGIVVVGGGVTGYYAIQFADQLQNPPPALSVTITQQTGTVVTTHAFNGTAPTDQANVSVTMQHTAGPVVDAERLEITVNGYPAYDVYDAPDPYAYATLAAQPIADEWTAGERARVVVYGNDVYHTGENSPNGLPSFFHNTGTLRKPLDSPSDHRANELQSGDIIRLVWTSPTGLNKHVLTEAVLR